jgi:hypothetical protein
MRRTMIVVATAVLAVGSTSKAWPQPAKPGLERIMLAVDDLEYRDLLS